jgi:hypothetical protein
MNGQQTLTNHKMNLRLKTLISGGTPRPPACSRKMPDVSYNWSQALFSIRPNQPGNSDKKSRLRASIQQQQTKRMTPRLSDVSYHEYFLLPIARSAPKIENYDSQLLILLASCYSGFSRIKFGCVVCWCLFTSVSPNLNLCTLMILEILCRFTWVIFHMR